MEDIKKESIDFDFLITDFIESFKFYHSEEETEQLIFSILREEKVSILPSYLDVLDKKQLKENLFHVLTEYFENTSGEKEKLQKYIEVMKEQESKKLEAKSEKIKFKLKKVAMIGMIATTCMIASKSSNTKNLPVEYKKQQLSKENKLEIFQDPNFFENYILEERAPERKEYEKREKQRIQKEKEEYEKKRKEKVLKHYSKYRNIKQIRKRQKELESLEWKKSDKIYPKCKLKAPLQRFIYEQAVVMQLPADLLFSTIYAETRGGFSSSKKAYYNESSNSYDLGLTQQNSKYSLPSFQAKYHIPSTEEAYKLLKDNDYANVCASFLKYQEITSFLEEYDPYEFAGWYNGWENWEENSISRAYVKEFKKAYDSIFTNYHKVEKKKSIEKHKEKKR